MTELLAPYGSQKNEDLVAKVTPPIEINFFQPYGCSGLGSLVAKADVAPMPPKAPVRAAGRVRRLNASMD